MTGTDLIKKAGTYLGRKWEQFCRAYGFTYPVLWCCIYVWYVFSAANASKLFYSGSRVCNCRVAWNWCRVNLKHIKMKDAMPGDIVFFTWTGRGNNSGDGSLSIDHMGLIRAKGNANTCYTIEGNTGTGNPKTSSVMKRERSKKFILGIYRPKYKQEASKTNKKSAAAKVTMVKSMTDLAKYAAKRAREHHKYKIGGWSWTKGIECHGFTGTVYKDCGYDDIYKRIHKKGFWRKYDKATYLGKYLEGYYKSGVPVAKLKPGDILLTGKVRHHSGIYIGNGKVAEAVRKGTRVTSLKGRGFKYVFRIPDRGPTEKKSGTKTEKAAKKSSGTKKSTANTTANKQTTKEYKVVSKKGMNIRKDHNTKSEIAGVIACGETFKATKESDNWVYGSYKGIKGWVKVKSGAVTYLKVIK